MPEHQTAAPTLRELQRWMRWAVTDPRGVAVALAEPRPEDCHPPERYRSPNLEGPRWIAAETPELRIARLDVYAEGYFTRIVEALVGDFPTLHEAIGPQGFAKLVADFLKVCPTRSWTLSEAGRRLPEFLTSHALAHEAPWLADLARWEWCALLAFHAVDLPPLDAQRLQSVPEAAWADARIALHPSVQLLSLEWPVLQLRDDIRAGAFESVGHTVRTPTHVAVVRQGEGGTATLELEPGAMHLLRRLGEGVALGQVCDEAAGVLADSTEQAAAQAVLAWFSEWMRAGLIGRIEFEAMIPLRAEA